MFDALVRSLNKSIFNYVNRGSFYCSTAAGRFCIVLYMGLPNDNGGVVTDEAQRHVTPNLNSAGSHEQLSRSTETATGR